MFNRLSIVLVLAGLATAVTSAQTADPMAGTWTLNAAKSKTYTSGTSVIEAVDGGLKATVDLVSRDGTKYHWTWTAKYDGNEAPVDGATPYGQSKQTISLTHTDPRHAKVVARVDGKVMATHTVTVSPDGKTRTIHSTGKNAKGEAVDTTNVYEKH